MNEKKKKVLLVSHEMSYTGAPRSLLNIAKILQKANAKVEIWTLKDGDFLQEFEREGFQINNFPEIISEESIREYELIILNTFFTAYLIEKFQKITRTVLYIREAQNITILAEDCGLNIDNIRKAKEVICVSEYAETFIKGLCMPHKLWVLHNFVKDEYDGRLNIVRDGIIHFLLSGTYERRKGFDIAVEAFLHMPEELKGITRLHIVGQMPDWSRTFWEQQRERYDERIIEHGEIIHAAERLALYRQMNVFVIPSRDEACSLVALEGAMLGKALIMSENVGAQYLDKKKKGIYPTEDINVLCRKMSNLTSRKELLVWGMEMRKAYRKMATLKKYKKEFFKIYTQQEGY